METQELHHLIPKREKKYQDGNGKASGDRSHHPDSMGNNHKLGKPDTPRRQVQGSWSFISQRLLRKHAWAQPQRSVRNPGMQVGLDGKKYPARLRRDCNLQIPLMSPT